MEERRLSPLPSAPVESPYFSGADHLPDTRPSSSGFSTFHSHLTSGYREGEHLLLEKLPPGSFSKILNTLYEVVQC